MKESVPPKLKKFSTAKQRVLDQLLEKNSEGTITPSERLKLEHLVAEAERLMVTNGKRMASFTGSEMETELSGAVPVTVWIKPEPVER